ncbi:hypothetical protein [Actinoallomurus rhizosphaericola]|uniref:hypothetical protein n=1 Tax=Actinoallomurus rhizosphaericola TaxID=2952536 RepID=UPI002092D457|nr:hypothetical protein [Actinoallomurus rhizosphaericola]MCO5998085.1 hypothetical protein [Actinoallomurus rhizosphaericola]
MSSQSGPGDRVESLGIRQPVELPKVDIDEAGDLAPAGGVEPAQEGDGPATEDEKAGEASEPPKDGETPEPPKDGETPEPPKDGPSTAKEKEKKEDAAPDADVAVAAVPQGGAANGDEMPPDRPKKPVLAAVAIGGVVLLAIPILLVDTGSRHARKHPVSAAADRVLSGNGQQPPPGAYTSMSPSATPTSAPSATPSAHATHKPASGKSAAPTASGKSSPRVQAAHKGGSSVKAAGKSGSAVKAAAHKGVPASEKPVSGGNPWALEVHAPYDLNPGKTLRTNRLALTMQKGGNLVLRDPSGKIIWSTGTHHAGAYAEFQTDGNLVVYINGRQAVWGAGTFGHDGATLVLQADYNMVIYDGHNALWATNTYR